MILNLHGFTGRGRNSKYDWLRANLPRERVEAPDLDYAGTPPAAVFDRLRRLVADNRPERVRVLGSSLGGFFALALRLADPSLPAVLINPCLAPDVSLAGHLDERPFLELRASLGRGGPQDRAAGPGGAPPRPPGDALQAQEPGPGPAPLDVLLGDADELIDHRRLTLPNLPEGASIHWIPGGIHRLGLTGEAAAILLRVLA